MNDCIFCGIAAGRIPSKKIFEDGEMFVFHDIDPKAPVHFLVVPRRHIKNLMECGAEDAALLGRLLVKAQEVARELGCGAAGARFVINCKSGAGQTVDHLHIHVLGGRGLSWPPG
jgi:histidine triad (HIT) family protein